MPLPLIFGNVLDIMRKGRVKLSMMTVSKGRSKTEIAILSENQMSHWNKIKGRYEL
jgi:hypothetical protein